MTWRVWGRRLETADLTSTSVYQTIKFNSNIVFRGVRLWVIHYNDPTYTNLNLKLYTGSTGSTSTSVPKELLATSTNIQTKASIAETEVNAHKEIWFEFNDIALNKDTVYHLVVNGSGYTSNWPTSGLALRRAFPDPIYTTNISVNWNNLNRLPFMYTIIGAEI